MSLSQAMRSAPPHPRHRRRGTILIVAMILVFAIAALVLTLGLAMRVEASASANVAAEREATAIVRGAEQYVMAVLAESTDPIDLLDESYFEEVPLGGGYFWILRPAYDDPAMPVFGITDETCKIDLNTFASAYERLSEMPVLTDELAASIIDWGDEDENPTEGFGAESQVYASRTPGHDAKNAPYESVEELMLVDGMTSELLYGDGTAPPIGQAGLSADQGYFQGEGYRPRGLFDLFTVWGVEAEASFDEGTPRLNVNDDESREAVREMLIEEFGEARGAELAGRVPSQDVLDIFDFALRLDLEPEELAQIEDRISVAQTQTFQSGNTIVQVVMSQGGKINVNWAAREVLMTLIQVHPSLEESDIDAMISERITAIQEMPNSIAWVYELLGAESVGLARYITARGRFYSADIVAVSGNGRAFKRVRIVVDSGATNAEGVVYPRIVYRRDLTDHGWPMDPALLESLRTGGGAYGAFTTW